MNENRQLAEGPSRSDEEEILKAAHVVKKTQIVRLKRVETDENYLCTLPFCDKCNSRGFQKCKGQFSCYRCGSLSCEEHYSIKCRYVAIDEERSPEFQGEICDKVVQLMFQKYLEKEVILEAAEFNKLTNKEKK